LSARATLAEEIEAQSAFRNAQAERLTLARARYENGISSYLDLLDAERELFTAEQALVQSQLLRLTNAVDLYRSLGGGFSEPEKQ
jgi:multidrug efflux system outer membrane protein